MTENLKKFMKESGFVSVEEVANIFEITATEFSDSKYTEIARDYMIAAATLRENARLTKALADCYMLARRAVTPLLRGARDGFRLTHAQMTEKENWEHIIRFCEETGMKPEILRAQVPTEIIGG